MTGAIVIGPPDPRDQLAVCAALEADTDIAACIRGTKVQNLINYPDNLQVELIQDCSQFRGHDVADVLPLAGQDARRASATASSAPRAAPSSLPPPRAARASRA